MTHKYLVLKVAGEGLVEVCDRELADGRAGDRVQRRGEHHVHHLQRDTSETSTNILKILIIMRLRKKKTFFILVTILVQKSCFCALHNVVVTI